MTFELREVRSAQAPAPIGPYSQGIAIGGLVFASGQIPIDPETGRLVEGDIEVQTERALANAAAVLAAAGTHLGRVVKTSVFLIDMAEFPRMNAVYERHFPSYPRPARSTVQVAKLPAGARIEIEVIAAL